MIVNFNKEFKAREGKESGFKETYVLADNLKTLSKLMKLKIRSGSR